DGDTRCRSLPPARRHCDWRHACARPGRTARTAGRGRLRLSLLRQDGGARHSAPDAGAVMLAMEEYLCGSGKPGQEKAPVAAWRWWRPLLQWSGVGLAHAALLGIVLQVSPQARQVL